MDHLFMFTSFILMWLMIFGVSLVYYGMISPKNRRHTLFFTLVSVLITILFWFCCGQTLVFGNWPNLWEFSILNHQFILASSRNTENLLMCCFQLSFCLYGVVMLNGAVLERINWQFFSFFLPFWLITVYVPMARLLWHDQGWLKQLGVLDFSGGIVVHLSAGVSSLVLAFLVGPSKPPGEKGEQMPSVIVFLGTALICFGWFAFNTGPVGEVNDLTALILINTLCTMIGGSFGWLVIDLKQAGQPSLLGSLNGLVIGLVSSTAGVAYLSPLSSFLIAGVAGVIGNYGSAWLKVFKRIDDPVDSFVINGLGGLWGAVGTGIFANMAINAQGSNGLIYFNFELLVKQLIGILICVLISVTMTYCWAKVLSYWLPIRVSLKKEALGLDHSELKPD